MKATWTSGARKVLQRTPEHLAKLSAALKAKWASGTRKPSPPETYTKASATYRRNYREGRVTPRSMTSEQARAMQARVTPEGKQRILEHLRARATARIGMPNPPGSRAVRGAGNYRSMYWILSAPGDVNVEGWNLNELVRNNAHMFSPADLETDSGGTCRATHMLKMLFRTPTPRSPKPPPNSWKGWRAVSKERRERPSTP